VKMLKAVLAIGLIATVSSAANASAIIMDGNVKLGVDELGQLNIPGGVSDISGETYVGLRYLPPDGTPGAGEEYESTSHGCLCEGWGVGNADSNTSGYANNSLGIGGLALESFTSTAGTATSVVNMSDELRVTHHFELSEQSDNLYRVSVEIENVSDVAISDVRYRRTFDWDTSPTPFSEYVTIQGADAATAVLAANDNGFCNSNPFVACGSIIADGDFTDSGPADHGSNFDFAFGELDVGGIYEFDIFYGGAANYDDAIAALTAVNAEVYSLGWSGLDADQDGFADGSGTGAGGVVPTSASVFTDSLAQATPTFIFGFSGVGGTGLGGPVDQQPPSISEPPVYALFAVGLLALMRLRRNH
jgi:type IV pilus assembly protein PilY1